MTVRNLFDGDTMSELDKRYEIKVVSYYSSQIKAMWPSRWSERQLFKWACPRWRLPALQGFLINLLYHWNLHAFSREHSLFTMEQRLSLYKEKHRIRYHFDREVGARIVALFRGKDKDRDLLRDFVYLTPVQKGLQLVKALLVASTDLSKDQQLIYTFRKIGIPVIALVHSFDNLTAKGLLSTKPDRLLVWNEIMRKEAVDYHGFDTANVAIVGVPQFEKYRRLSAEASEFRFRKRLNIQNGVKVITYTGSAISMFPDEEQFVEELVGAISRGECGQSVLVLRIHPPDVRQEAYCKKYEKSDLPIRIDFPDSGFSALNTGDIGNRESVLEFVELMKFSDVVVNLSSTITLDAVLFDTPVICLNFNYLAEDALNAAHMHHKCEHYHAIVESTAVDFPNSMNELILDINSYLRNPEKNSSERQRLSKRMMPDLPTSRLIAEDVEKAIVDSS